MNHEPRTTNLYRHLYLPRAIEEKMLRLIRQGRISKWFSGYGQEAISVGCTRALQPADVILPTHRNLGVWTTRGVPLGRLFCQLMGRQGGFTKGRDRTFHFGVPEHRIVGMISHMAAMLPVACGFGYAAQVKQESYLALAFVGDGATRQGDFHEALSLASIWNLPVIFVIENNAYGLSTPTRAAIAAENLAGAAQGYGMPGETVDGNDIFAVMEAVERAAARARSGEGPTLLEMNTFRMRGHEEASGTKYVPQDLIDAWALRDPVLHVRNGALASGEMNEEQIARMEQEIAQEVHEAAEYALKQPEVESTIERERSDLFAPAPAPAPDPSRVPGESTVQRRFIDAISEGLREAMRADERVLLFGQDIAGYGGVFKVTTGFLDEFGPQRVRDTPIIESGVVGMALGLALEGFKPVVEMQYADFITCGFNQIVNNLATTHYRWGAPINVTIRAPFGGYVGAGPFHSQSPEAWFVHTPGLKVVVPATPEDAKGLLITTIEEPNPVLFFEHKYLYRALKGDVPEGLYETPLGKARVAKEGTDLTVVTYGIGVHWAMEEAVRLEDGGVSVEVLDLRTLVPWDREAVLASVEKTGRLLVLHEATRTAGFGAEVAAQIAEEGFSYLDAPPVRVAAEDLPVPFSSQPEKEVFSARSKLQRALSQVLSY